MADQFLSSELSPADSQMVQDTWAALRKSARRMIAENPFLKNLGKDIFLKSPDMAAALSKVLARHNLDHFYGYKELAKLFLSVYKQAPELVASAAVDIKAVSERDPAATDPLLPFLHFKGFHALQTYRISHWFWDHGQKDLAVFLQNRSSLLYAVDIHPAAKIGRGIMLDHAHSIVIGETSVVEDNVSMLHEVTLGGTGKVRGDRHPKVREGVMIGAGAKILGNMEIGKVASVAAGSVVLAAVPQHTTVAGIPAKVVGKPKAEVPATEMDQTLPE